MMQDDDQPKNPDDASSSGESSAASEGLEPIAQAGEDAGVDVKALREDIDKLLGEFEERGGFVPEDVGALRDVYYMWLLWADFHVVITQPYIAYERPARIIRPEYDAATDIKENVYPIFDYGSQLSTSRAEDIVNGATATGKYLNTIEKLLKIAIERCKNLPEEGSEEEIRLSFRGHEVGLRKGFETAVLLSPRVVVINYEPGEWGERHLKTIDELVNRGFPPPPIAPVV